VEEDQVREYLYKLHICKSMGPGGIHPQVLGELADVIARKVNVTPIFRKGKKEDPGNYRPVSLTSILKNFSRHINNKTIIRNSLQGFTKGNSFSANLMNFYDEMTTW